MSKVKKYFGTDGIRGRVGEYPVTPDFFLKLGWATGRVFSKTPGSTVLIGKDTRISGYMFESALEAGLTSAGVDIKLLGPMPTPGVAHLTSTFQAQAGIVISASHNSYEDNGIKFFSAQCKIDPAFLCCLSIMQKSNIAGYRSVPLRDSKRTMASLILLHCSS